MLAPATLPRVLIGGALAQGFFWFAVWLFLRRTQRGWTKTVLLSVDSPKIGLVLSLVGYASWFLGSVMFALYPASSLFRTFSPTVSFPKVGLGLLIGGHGMVVWSALSLGPSFGLRPRIIVEHRLVRHGPYRIVRHPLYTGLHALYLGTFLLVPCGLFLFSFVAALIGNTVRARAEERLLSAHYGEVYRTYARSVGRFLPKICVRKFSPS